MAMTAKMIARVAFKTKLFVGYKKYIYSFLYNTNNDIEMFLHISKS